MTQHPPAAPTDNYLLPLVVAVGLTVGCLLTIAFAIHIQIPDQNYCDDAFATRHGGAFASLAYHESLVRYDYSFNQSRCIYTPDGKFIANPEFSIWGVRV